MLSLHADWAVGDAAAFRRTADLALATARRHDRLVTVGIVPSRPETGYGYIVPGAPLDADAARVARFSEKPDAATALDLMAAGALWNSGLFAWTAARLLAEVDGPHAGGRRAPCPRSRRGDVGGFFGDVVPDLDRRRPAGAERRRRGGARRLRLGRRGHLAGARPGCGPRIPSGNVVVGPALAARRARLHRLVATAIRRA